MQKRDYLYTVSKGNKRAVNKRLGQKPNIFWPGGPLWGDPDVGNVSEQLSNGQSIWPSEQMNMPNISPASISGSVVNNPSLQAPQLSKGIDPNFKVDVPKQKSGGLSDGAKSAITALAPAAGNLIGGALSGGLESKAGSAITNIGSTVGGAMTAIPGIGTAAGAIVTGASAIIGGLTNGAFGSKLNQQKISEVSGETDALNKAQVDDSSTDAVLQSSQALDFGSNFSKSDIGKDGWFSNKAKKKYQELKRKRKAAISLANEKVAMAADSADQSLDDQNMRGFFGYGGNLYDDGGTLLSHGATWDTGVKHINKGGTHEQNPNEGIQMGVDHEGTPNLVEEGEVIWNDFVFSNRINVPDEVKKRYKIRGKKDMSFADAAKKIQDEEKERPNDPISKAGLNAALEDLANAQETLKQAEQAKKAQEEFAKLSPEQQQAVMQELAAREQAAQEQAVAQQQQQVSPEQQQMLEEQQMEQGNINAYGGKVNKFDDGGDKGYTSYAAMNNYGIANGGLSGIPLDNRYKTWDSFVYGDNQPIWVNDGYIPEYGGASVTAKDYQNNGFYKWLQSDAGDAFRKSWWTKENAPNFYKRNKEGIMPTMADLVGSDGKAGLMFDKNYGDAHAFGAAAYNEYNKTKTPKAAKATPKIFHAVVGDDEYLPEDTLDMGKVGNEVRRETLPNGDTVIWHASQAAPDETQVGDTGKKEIQELEPVHKAEWPRYVGLMGPAIGLGLQALGVGKPDYSGLDAAVATSSETPIMARHRSIGHYLAYNPFDRNYEANKQEASSRATDRAIANQSAGNRGTKVAGLLANGYNNNIALGDLGVKAAQYNFNQRKEVEGFNRDTDKFNAEAFNRAALQYASDYNSQRRFKSQMQMEAAKQRMDADAGWYNSLYGNIGQLTSGIGQLGKENAQHNMIADMAAQGLFGAIDPDSPMGMRVVRFADNRRRKRRAEEG